MKYIIAILLVLLLFLGFSCEHTPPANNNLDTLYGNVDTPFADSLVHSQTSVYVESLAKKNPKVVYLPFDTAAFLNTGVKVSSNDFADYMDSSFSSMAKTSKEVSAVYREYFMSILARYDSLRHGH